jgi:WD40 repeat protein
MVTSRQSSAKDGFMKRLVILILLNFVVACTLRSASDAKPKLLDVVFSKEFPSASLRKVEFSRDGKSILAAPYSGAVYVVDSEDFSMTALEFEGLLENAGFIPNSNEIFAIDEDGFVQIWDSNLKKRFSYKFPERGKLASVSEDARYIAYGGYLYDTSANKLLAEPASHAFQTALQFHGNDYVLSAGHWDQSVIIRNLTNDTRTLWRTDDRISAAAAVDDFIVAGTDDGDCYVWTMPGDKPVRTITGWGGIYLMAKHPRDPIFAISREDSATVYSLRPFKRLLDIEASDLIQSLTLSENGIIALGESNGTIQMWDIYKKALIGTYSVDNDTIYGLAIDPKTSNLAAGTSSGKLLLLKANVESHGGTP